MANNLRKKVCHKGHPLSGANVRVVKKRGAIERHCLTCRREWAHQNRLKGDCTVGEKAVATHCRAGHELVGDNVRIRSGNARVCRLCERVRQRELSRVRRRRRKAAALSDLRAYDATGEAKDGNE